MISRLKSTLSHYKDVIYNKYYPPQLIFRKNQRKRLKNKNFSLLAGNCIAGYLYHQLGLPFLSPTINMMIYNQDLKKMLLNLDYYMSIEPTPTVDPNFPNVPCAKIDDVILHFTHYKSIEEGISAWEKRKKRVDYNNLYIIISDRDFTKDDIEELSTVKCKKIVVMTAHNYGFDHCLYLPVYEGRNSVGTLLGKTISGKWEFEKYFDFIEWVNSEDEIAQHFYIGR